MDSLEKNIIEQRKLLDDLEPAVGHEVRFLNRLEKNSLQRKLPLAWIIAASVALILALFFMGVQNRLFNSQPALSGISVEFRDAEWFYQQEYHKNLERLSVFLSNQPQQEQIILNELSFMDDQYKQLKEDILKNPNDPRALNALINYYQTKIDFIDQVLYQLNDVANINIKNYENSKI